MQFHYIAINQQNQQLNGNIHAENENDARKELNKLGFSVLSVNKVDENAEINENDNLKLNKYKFEALDTSGKKVIGTITSKDSKHAYVRLIEEYHFKVESLNDINSPNSKEDLTSLAQYLESVTTVSENKNKDENTQNIQSNLKELDEILLFINDSFKNYDNNFTIQGKKKINELRDNLIRIKNSFNTEYIKKISTDLLNEFNDKTNFKNDPDSQQIQSKLSLESQKLLLNLDRSTSYASKEINLSSLIGKKEKVPIQNKNHEDKPELRHDELYLIKQALIQNKIDIKNDITLWFRSTSNNRKILTAEIKNLLAKRKELKKDLNKNEKKRSISTLNNQKIIETTNKSIWNEFYYFSGWLSVFYLFYYFISYYIWTKEFYLAQNLRNIIKNPYEDSIIRNLTILIFVVHCFISIQKNIFQSKNKNLWISALTGFAITILIISNF